MSPPLRVLFVCLHGAAKSVVAAEYFARLAVGSGCDVEVASAGVEPDEQIPPHVVGGLRGDGFDVSGRMPQPLTASAVARSDVVVSFGCDVETDQASSTLIRWDDVPHVSDGYEVARDAIVARLETLLREMSADRARSMRD